VQRLVADLLEQERILERGDGVVGEALDAIAPVTVGAEVRGWQTFVLRRDQPEEVVVGEQGKQDRRLATVAVEQVADEFILGAAVDDRELASGHQRGDDRRTRELRIAQRRLGRVAVVRGGRENQRWVGRGPGAVGGDTRSVRAVPVRN
jgi:hypothetical protein